MSLAEVLQRELDRKRWSQADLGRAMGVGRSTVNRWFKPGASVPPKTVQRIAATLGVDPLPLLSAQTHPDAPTGDFLTLEAQAIARRWQSLPPTEREHFRWLIETVAAAHNESYQQWEAKEAAKVRARGKVRA
jgi:transcriptional regulator with XRE-family HTH domain